MKHIWQTNSVCAIILPGRDESFKELTRRSIERYSIKLAGAIQTRTLLYMILQSNRQLKSCHPTLVAKSLTVLIKPYIADTVSIL
jgi:hypothetical protein